MPYLFHHLISHSAINSPDTTALILKDDKKSYSELKSDVENIACALKNLGLKPNSRVAIYLPKQFESVISFFAITLAGGIFIPINPLLKPHQVKYIMDDCDVELLITSQSRFKQLTKGLDSFPEKLKIVLTNSQKQLEEQLENTHSKLFYWDELVDNQFTGNTPNKPEDNDRSSQDISAILYTSGSTGQPKGVVLSHQNLIEGAKSVSSYLNNSNSDRLLAVLPFSFDYGLSQLTTAFFKGASVVLLEYLLPRDVINAVVKYKVTGLAAVPPLWVQLADLEWPEQAKQSLRYFTNSGGAMPESILSKLRHSLPNTSPFLMYGLTEAFRSTYLDPKEVDNKPGSMGKAIPNAEILLINEQGNLCAPNEEGELVHRGVHVAMGYWNAPEMTAERFKPLPAPINNLNKITGIHFPLAVWSGDYAKKDEDGFLYFVGRKDEMIKCSGYRISPAEIEECLYQMDEVNEAIALGVNDEKLGQKIRLIIKLEIKIENDEEKKLQFKKLISKHCKKNLPNYMQPHDIIFKNKLPKNPNGKIDRSLLSSLSSI